MNGGVGDMQLASRFESRREGMLGKGEQCQLQNF